MKFISNLNTTKIVLFSNIYARSRKCICILGYLIYPICFPISVLILQISKHKVQGKQDEHQVTIRKIHTSTPLYSAYHLVEIEV